ncbi:MAG: RDD family protein [Nocardioides sp.]
MSETPQDPDQQPPGYPSAPPPSPAPQGGWGDAPGYPGAPGGYAPPAPYADWIKRVGGYLVDVAVLLPAYVIVFIGLGLGSADNSADNSAVSSFGLILLGIGYLAIFGIAIWNMIIRQGKTGWSIGKQVIGIRLIAEKTGQPLGPGLTFVRMLAHILDSLPCYLGYLWPLWDAKRQTFADKIMGTVVIEQKKV